MVTRGYEKKFGTKELGEGVLRAYQERAVMRQIKTLGRCLRGVEGGDVGGDWLGGSPEQKNGKKNIFITQRGGGG